MKITIEIGDQSWVLYPMDSGPLSARAFTKAQGSIISDVLRVTADLVEEACDGQG